MDLTLVAFALILSLCWIKTIIWGWKYTYLLCVLTSMYEIITLPCDYL